jgi:hypothetical protein
LKNVNPDTLDLEVDSLVRQIRGVEADISALDATVRKMTDLLNPEWEMIDGLLLSRESQSYYRDVKELHTRLTRLYESATTLLEASRSFLKTAAERRSAFKKLFDLLNRTERRFDKLVISADAYTRGASKRLGQKTYSTEVDASKPIIAAIKLTNLAGKLLDAIVKKRKQVRLEP